MVAFALQHRKALADFELIATGTTGKMLQDRVGLKVERMLSRPLGGDVQIAAGVIDGTVHAVFFFVGPLDKPPHDPDIQTFMRARSVHNVPLATNMATAQFVLSRGHHLRGSSEESTLDGET